ncbi:4'-phosphopantetheinyl transferase family protein [Herbiconiux daphne]|uniref:4'-phosphopantetheinyl transferase superfamily protein n=1 Tax=Herbiconiux daphne TaxID=2970914 RepID=A0ABT2H6P0_9MICO|nr:4'-phosphopantetheinyl transferase superfamily protein [Herbiconiux daphne]MCS5735606.1 4'-phosphopantetheinyl transferase superfamily protein [Herbiconiux daphne]
MIEAATDPEGGTRDGCALIGSVEVFWRFGHAPSPSTTRADVSRTAHRWLARLVADRDVFAWRGLERSGPWSKPQPVGAPDADVSISHTGPVILVAACRGARVGADIEPATSTAFDSASLTRRMCTPHEEEVAATLQGDARRRYLATVWTAKEAVVKAQGAGPGRPGPRRDFRTMVLDLPDPTALFSAAAAPAAGPAHPAAAAEPPFEAHLAILDENAQPLLHRLTF